MEQWAAKAFMGQARDEVLILNAAALGQIECLERLIDLDFEQFQIVIQEDLKDE